MELDAVIREAYPRLFRTALVLVGRPAEAEDLAQEACLRALRSAGSFRGRSERTTWLTGILMNVHREHVRAQQRRRSRLLRWFAQFGSERQVSPDAKDEALQREFELTLWTAVKQLPVPQQQVIALRFAEDLSYAEIAEVVDCPVGTVKSRLHAGLERLAQAPSLRADLSAATRARGRERRAHQRPDVMNEPAIEEEHCG